MRLFQALRLKTFLSMIFVTFWSTEGNRGRSRKSFPCRQRLLFRTQSIPKCLLVRDQKGLLYCAVVLSIIVGTPYPSSAKCRGGPERGRTGPCSFCYSPNM
ncbi:unnamed protein product [Ectocarpus sp. 6 AP-2014]